MINGHELMSVQSSLQRTAEFNQFSCRNVNHEENAPNENVQNVYRSDISRDSIVSSFTDSTPSLLNRAQRYCIQMFTEKYSLTAVPLEILCLVLMTSKIDTGHDND